MQNRGLYKVKWQGWDDEKDLTWEPKEHLDGALQKLKDFYFKRLEEREAAKPGKYVQYIHLCKESICARPN